MDGQQAMSDPEPTASSQRQNNVPSPAAASSQNLNSAIRHLQHDIRTPMNHILGFSELLIYEVQPSHSDEYTASLKKIHAAGKSILGRITETFTGLSGNNGPEMLEILRQAIHVYVEQALIDTNQASEYAVASGEAFVISAI